MKPNIHKHRILLLAGCVLAAMCSLAFTSCDNEDDISDIFVGRTWYVTGATVNGQSIDGDELKEIYAQADSYHLTFTATAFSGCLVVGSTLSGSWTADGKSHAISLQIKDAKSVESSTVSRNIYYILRDAASYKGDVNELRIYKDSQNFVRFYHTKNQ